MDMPATDAAPQPTRLQDYSAPPFRIHHVALTFELDEPVTRVTARLDVERTGPGPLVLDVGQDLTVVSIAVDDAPLGEDAWARNGESLTVVTVPDRFTLTTVSDIRPGDNTRLEGLYTSGGNFCTQCEAEGFRNITPYPDRPDVMARFHVRIEADKTRVPLLLSNGNRTAEGDLEDGRHFAEWDDPFPKPSYLFALVAGDLACLADRVTTLSGRDVALNIYAAEADIPKCHHAMASLIQALRWDEQVFGLEYDLDVYNIVAVSDFNMGAMENKSLNLFNTKYVLASPDTATDTDFDNIEGVIAHEYFHNWTGNRVTCRDWFQLSLKEGLTVFRDQEFSADMGSRAVKRIEDVRLLRAHQFPEDAGPTAHPVRPESYIEINNFYTPTVYNKGAEVIRMMHTLLGADGFRKGMDLYFQRHDGQAVTCEDFVRAMEDATGIDLDQFRLWYSQAGTPVLDVAAAYDAEAREYRLTVAQSCPPTLDQPDKAAMHIPLKVGLVGPNGADLDATLDGDGARQPDGYLLDVRQPRQTFVFKDVGARPVASLLRGFSAPVNLRSNLRPDDLLFLLAHDRDPFARWEAGQRLAADLLLALAADHQAGRPLTLDDAFVEAIGAVLDDTTTDPALIGEAVTLPGETYLAQLMEVVDPDGLHAARQFARAELGRRLADRWHRAYAAGAPADAGSLTQAAKARRKLKNVALGYLAAADAAGVALCERQYDAAANMTDRLAALALLVDTDAPARQAALDGFYDRWRDDALVLDKWFAIQALSRRADTLDRVVALVDHPDFTLRNPNRFRSLVATFATLNQVRFHDPSGGGYRFLVDMIAKLDAMNPQVAARTLGALRQWRRFDAGRQAAMKAQLERLLAADGLSKDTFEIASKSLA